MKFAISAKVIEEAMKVLTLDNPHIVEDQPEIVAALCFYLQHHITASVMSGIKWQQIDLREGELRFIRTKQPHPVIVLQDPLWDCLDRMHDGQAPEERVFTGEQVELVRSKFYAWRSGLRAFAEDLSMQESLTLTREHQAPFSAAKQKRCPLTDDVRSKISTSMKKRHADKREYIA